MSLFDIEVEVVKSVPPTVRIRPPEMGTPGRTKAWAVAGPGGDWLVFDHGDEMSVRGPGKDGPLVARVKEKWVRRMSPGDKWYHVEDAVGAIHVAKLLGAETPRFHLLWQLG